MTIDAAADQQIRAGGCAARQSLGCIDDRRMACALVTRLAQERRPNFKKRRLRRTVRIVTVSAVLGHRLMFPEKWAAVFGVTGRASLIDGVFYQLRRGGG